MEWKIIRYTCILILKMAVCLDTAQLAVECELCGSVLRHSLVLASMLLLQKKWQLLHRAIPICSRSPSQFPKKDGTNQIYMINPQK